LFDVTVKQLHDTPANRSHAATAFSARTRGHNLRSNSLSNAARIPINDPARLKAWGDSALTNRSLIIAVKPKSW
jgi:hypothetical protein